MTGSTDETVVGPDTIPSERRPVPLSRGDVVGRYVVLQKLGAGGMGVVFAAYDPELDRKVALKLLHAQPSDQSRATEGHKRLLREAQAMAKLSHPNVITVHDVGEHSGRVFLAMEFVDGETLTEHLKKDRSWREVVDVFSKAGAGLAAAHAKGLIHRDFKPDNVMIGKDGRVRVMDFGLARSSAEDDLTAKPIVERDDLVQATGTDALAAALTRHGAMLGTPAYMAPEQWLGEQTDARTDQFSFCVALYEGLYGQRPFAGKGVTELAIAVTEGKPRTPPSSSVPNWLKKLVLRGLATEPRQRWPSMAELLAELSRGQGRARTRTLLAGMGALAALGAGALGYERYDEAQVIAACEADGAAISKVWNDTTRERLRAGLLATGESYADTVADNVVPYFDAQASALQEARTQSCLDARVLERWDEQTLERSVWCLEQRRMQLEALLEELSQADSTAVRQAVAAAAKLSRVDACRDPTRLSRKPEQPGDRAGMMAVRQTLSRAEALGAAGNYQAGMEVLQQALAQARELEWAPLTLAVEFRKGVLQQNLGIYDEAEATLEAVYFEAAKLELGMLVAETARELALTVGHYQKRAKEGRLWIEHLDVALAQLGEEDDGLARGRALNALGLIEWDAGDYEKAKSLQERALAINEGHLGPEHPSVATDLANLANVHAAMGDYPGAAELFQRAIAIDEVSIGPEHPTIANVVNNLGNVQAMMGSLEDAKASYERALAIREKSLGPEHPYVASVLNNLANLNRMLGAHADARDISERALALNQKLLGPDHPEVAVSLGNLALILHAEGEFADSKPLLERAIAINEATLGSEHPALAEHLNNLAVAHENLGEYADAKSLYRRALDILEKAVGPEHPNTGYPLTGLANVSLADGHPADAIRFAERALKIGETVDFVPEVEAERSFCLARALWEAPPDEGRDRERARALAIQARDAYREAPGREKELADVGAWLEAHGGDEG